MAKLIEIAIIQSLLTKLVTSFTETLNKQTEALKKIFEGRFDVLEHYVFDWKEKGDKITNKKGKVKKHIVSQKEIIQKLEQKAAKNRGAIIEAKQQKLDQDLIVISPIHKDPFDLSLAKLSTTKPSRPTKNGKFRLTL